MGNQISMVIADAAPAMPNMTSGKIRALAVTSAKRSPFTPELPTFAEEGLKGSEAVNWWGILFPTGVPRAIISKVNADVVKVLAMSDVKEKLAVFGVEAVSSTRKSSASTWTPSARSGASSSRKPISGWIDQSGLNRSASLSRFSNTMSHTPWPN